MPAVTIKESPEAIAFRERKMKEGRFAYTPVTHADGNFTLGIAVEGLPGYHATTYPSVDTYDKAAEWADALNARHLKDKKDAFRIVASTMHRRKLYPD